MDLFSEAWLGAPGYGVEPIVPWESAAACHLSEVESGSLLEKTVLGSADPMFDLYGESSETLAALSFILCSKLSPKRYGSASLNRSWISQVDDIWIPLLQDVSCRSYCLFTLTTASKKLK